MKTVSTVVSRAIPETERIDRGPVWARNMGKSRVPDSRTNEDAGEQVSVGTLQAPTHNFPAQAPTYTLRVKPDRRRKQVPIPAGTDRRGS